ncbi:MAG: lipopolysaccharide kinase InaA family protein [bacterium]|nr:lipopolysaccharide kinase InaA family protein [bacterium]
MRAPSERGGTVIVAERYRDLLAALGLRAFDDFIRFAGGEPVREKGDRSIVRLSPPGSPPLYLKRHAPGTVLGALRALLSGARPLAPAVAEWEAIAAARAAGVATMEPIAVGSRARRPALGPSFLVTAAAPGLRLEGEGRFFRGKFRERRDIIAALADTARRMHAAGLNHRDFYLSHIFLDPAGGGRRIVLIDLQRLQRRARGRNRWVVKDLAALNYSSPAPEVSRTDRLFFLRRYLRAARLDAAARRFARRIAAKTARIRAHDMKRRQEGRR